MNPRARRVNTTAFTLAAAALPVSAWTDWTPGILTAATLITVTGLTQAIDNRPGKTARDEQPGPQIPLDDRPPLWRRVLARLLGVHLDLDNH